MLAKNSLCWSAYRQIINRSKAIDSFDPYRRPYQQCVSSEKLYHQRQFLVLPESLLKQNSINTHKNYLILVLFSVLRHASLWKKHTSYDRLAQTLAYRLQQVQGGTVQAWQCIHKPVGRKHCT